MKHLPSQPPQTIVIVGAGPGIGLSVARRFARQGHRVGLVGRDASRLDSLVAALLDDTDAVAAEVADASDPHALRAALERLGGRLGPIDVLCFSPLPSVARIKPVLTTSSEDLLESFALSVGGAAAAVQVLAPAMTARGAGTVIFTSGSGALRPSADRAASAVTTSAQSMYISLLSQALAPFGVHVTHLAIVGGVGAAEKHHPDEIAEVAWAQHLAHDQAFVIVD